MVPFSYTAGYPAGISSAYQHEGMSCAGSKGLRRVIRLDQVILTLIDVDAVESK
jgi:hypothetical protein